nr:MAG TPA: hypothetical protein [Caudoviricetes sp.]
MQHTPHTLTRHIFLFNLEFDLKMPYMSQIT